MEPFSSYTARDQLRRLASNSARAGAREVSKNSESTLTPNVQASIFGQGSPID